MRIPALFLTILFLFPGCRNNSQSLPDVQTGIEYMPRNTVSTIQTLSFGSCNDEDESQNYWNTILETDPDLWIWMGDNIYGDSEDMNILKNKYDKQNNHIEYKEFIRQIPIIGIWYDHDFVINDGNRLYPKKEESKDLMLDFLNVPEDAEVRLRSGAYHSYIFGEEGRKVKIILLDTRSFQDPLTENPNGVPRYFPSDGTLLGADQWTWLQEELDKNEAEVHIIVSSIQFLASKQVYEKWGNFPDERFRMIDLVKNTKARNVIFLSGDRHIAEVSKLDLTGIEYPLYDITSSGLTHSYEQADEENPFRIGPLIGSKNFGILRFTWLDDRVAIEVEIWGMNGEIYFNHRLGQFSF